MSDALVVYAAGQPEPETHQDRVNRCRPASRWSRDIANALASAERELQAAAARLDREQSSRSALVLTGRVEQIQKADRDIARMAIEHEQFGEIVKRLTADLASAQANEAEGAQRLQSLADAAHESNAKFRRWLEVEYTKHARAIAEGLEKFQLPASAAAQALNTARQVHPFAPSPSIDPAPSLNGAVALPGINAGPAFVTPPVPRQVSGASVYAR
jgi:hypothetical protein